MIDLLHTDLLFGFLILPVWTPAAAAITLFGALQSSKGLGEWLGDEGGGTNLAFSKFCTDPAAWTMPSKQGMGLIAASGLLASLGGYSYLCTKVGPLSPAALDSLAGLLSSNRSLLMALLLAAHYGRRLVEVLAVHKFTSSMEVPIALEQAAMALALVIQILWSVYKVPDQLYASTAVAAAGGAVQLPNWLGGGSAPLWPLAGCCLFLLGELGCCYHHLLLRQLRQGRGQGANARAYAIPRGGAFGLLVCPHYLFEALAWWGIALASQHLQAFIIAAAISSFLAGRSAATKRWYLKKFEDFPTARL